MMPTGATHAGRGRYPIQLRLLFNYRSLFLPTPRPPRIAQTVDRIVNRSVDRCSVHTSNRALDFHAPRGLEFRDFEEDRFVIVGESGRFHWHRSLVDVRRAILL